MLSPTLFQNLSLRIQFRSLVIVALAAFIAACDDDEESSSGGSSDNFCLGALPIESSAVAWKPVSDQTGGLEVIVPSDLAQPTITITAFNGEMETAQFDPAVTLDGRILYRFARPGPGYQGPVCLSIGVNQIIVNNPGVETANATIIDPNVNPANTGAFPEAESLGVTGTVWKPVSEGDGNLVILTPSNFGNSSATILDISGNEVETGRFVGRTNGDRATYRFSRPGGGYSSPAYLRIGGTVYFIENTANRIN